MMGRGTEGNSFPAPKPLIQEKASDRARTGMVQCARNCADTSAVRLCFGRAGSASGGRREILIGEEE
jgi:hypothetical protein